MFDDLHWAGIFGWDYLRDLGRNRQKYLAGLSGLSRRNRRQERDAQSAGPALISAEIGRPHAA
jgi:DUF971 family protein